MTLDFYSKNPPTGELEQGDLLQPDAALQALIQTYHQYYAQHQENKLYVVLTQSCDLVFRDGACKAQYISIAPVRPLRTVINYHFEKKFVRPDVGDPLAPMTVKQEIERFLERLLNNNEPGHFYFHQLPEEKTLIQPMCAMLGLPISFRAEHYATILKARVRGVNTIFQAKLGWLLGQMYSRVASPELDLKELRHEVNEITKSLGVWFEPEIFKQFIKLLEAFKEANPGTAIDDSTIQKLIAQIQPKKKRVIERVLDVASEAQLAANPSPQRRKFRIALEQDPQLAQLLPS
jgi:hypothetical protein